MSDAYTTRKRITLIEPGTRPNTWGSVLNAAIQLIDDALGGWLELSTNTVLTSVNGATDQARMAMIRATAAITITIPSVQGRYWIDASNGDVVVTNGSNSVTVKSGNCVAVRTNGTTVYQSVFSDFGATIPKSSGTPTTDYHLTNKAWVSAQIAAASFSPGGAGTDGQFLKTVGTSIAWGDISTSDISGLDAALDSYYTKTASDARYYTQTQTDTALDLKASLSSPAFTGTPTVPTAPAGTSTMQAASTAFVAASNPIKAWAKVYSAVILRGQNVASVAGSGGSYSITYTTPIGTYGEPSAILITPSTAIASGITGKVTSETIDGFSVEFRTPGGTLVVPDDWSFVTLH